MSGKEVRMRHARRLAEITRDAESENKIGPRQSVDRPRHARCCSLLSSYDTTMYSMMLEQCRSLAVSLRAAAPRIVQACKWWCNEKRSDERALLNASIAEIEMCVGHGFSGECCCAYIGLLNPGAQSISYVAASQHSQMGGRSLQVDQGMASKCISENKTIVVENSEEARRLGVRVFGDSEQTFPAVCTPLRVRVGRPIGVLSVDGLRADTSVQRLTQKSMGPSVDFCDRLAPFLAKDDEACKRVRFWRAQSGDRPGVSGHYNKLVVARAICGHIYNIAKAKCGYNYCIRWEDGLSEENIPFRTLKELLRLTPQILGIGVLCDASVLGFVDYSGKVIGEHLIRLRTRVQIDKISQVAEMPNNTINGLLNESLKSTLRSILHARMAEIWEYDEHRQINVIARMGWNFAFSDMRAPRRLLEIPAHKRHLFWSKVEYGLGFPMPFVNDILVAPVANYQSKNAGTRFLLVTKCVLDEMDLEDISSLRQISVALASACVWMSSRGSRELRRMHACKAVKSMCIDFALSTSCLVTKAKREIRQCLPKSNPQIGFLKTGGDSVSMMGHTEFRGNKSSIFTCLPPNASAFVILPGPAKTRPKNYLQGTRVQVQHGNLWYDALIQADRGHLEYDLVYDLSDWMGRPEREAGVPIARLRPARARHSGAVPRQWKTVTTLDDEELYPILIAPLGCKKGILWLDSWVPITDACDDETRIAKFLQDIGLNIGTAIDDKARGAALRCISSFRQNNKADHELTNIMSSILKQAVLLARRILFHHIASLTPPDMSGCNVLVARELLERCKKISQAGKPRGATLLFEATAEYTVLITVFEHEDHAKLVTQQKCAFCSLKYAAIGREDMAFFTKLGSLVQAELNTSPASERLAIIRFNTLRSLEQSISQKSAPLSEILSMAVDKISNAIASFQAFVAYVFPNNGDAFILCSSAASMVSLDSHLCNRIARKAKRLISRCITTQQPIVLLHAGESNLISNTGKRGSWICVPISGQASTTRAVLILEANAVNMTSGRIFNRMFDFAEAATTLVGSVIDLQCKGAELLALENLHVSHRNNSPNSMRDIYVQALGAIYRQLTFACRVSILQLRSRVPLHITLLLRISYIEGLSHAKNTPLVAVVYLDEVEVGRTYTDDVQYNFKSGVLALQLAEHWESAPLRVEVWYCTEHKLLGLVELDGSYYLHLIKSPRTYFLLDACHRPLSPSVSVGLEMSIQGSSNSGLALAPESFTNMLEEYKGFFIIHTSLGSMLTLPGQYLCVFYDQAGNEFGRTPRSLHTLCPKWTDLVIPVTETIASTSNSILIELHFVPDHKPHRVIGISIVAVATLVYLPRNSTELRLRMSTSAQGRSTKVGAPPQLSQEHLVLILRFARSTRRPKPLTCESKLPDLLASPCRLVAGVLEFWAATTGGTRSARAQAVPFEDIAAAIGEQNIGPAEGTCFVLIVACTSGSLQKEDARYICDVTAHLGLNIRHCRQRQLREGVRDRALAQIVSISNKWAHRSLPKLFDDLLYVLCHCLPGCHVYVSLLEPGAHELTCVACNGRSNMHGNKLLRGQGVSFSCISPEREHDVIIAHHHRRLHIFDKNFVLPYICVPLKHDHNALGILAADTFDYVYGFLEAQCHHPEEEILQLLQCTGAIVAKAIDARRRCDFLATLQRSVSSTQFQGLSLQAVSCNVLFLVACEIWEMNDERERRTVSSFKSGHESCSLFDCSLDGNSARVESASFTRLDMGNLVNTAFHAKTFEPKYICNSCRVLIVPLATPSQVRVLALIPIKEVELSYASLCYVKVVSRLICQSYQSGGT